MSIITCSDCGQRVSDAAAACIHCGRPWDRGVVTSASLDPVVQHAAGSGQPLTETGKVKWFDEFKGYGFISAGDGKESSCINQPCK